MVDVLRMSDVGRSVINGQGGRTERVVQWMLHKIKGRISEQIVHPMNDV